MADNTQGLPVLTKSGEFVEIKLVDTGGTNEAAVSAAGRLSVDASGVTVPVSDDGGSLTVDGTVSITGTVDTELPTAAALADNTANPTVPAVGGFLMAYDGTNWDRVRGDSTDGILVNLGANNDVTFSGAVDTELPAAASLTDNFANPTAPAVGAFGMLFDGSTWDRAPGTSADGMLVNLGANNDVTVTGSVSISGTPTVDTELPAAAALADGTANPTVPGVGGFMLGYNGTNWDRVRVANTGRLQVDVITGGGGSGGLGSPQFDYATTADLGAGSNANLDFDDIAGTTGELHGLDVWSAAPLKVTISTVTGGTPTTRVVVGTRPGERLQWRPPHQDYITHGAGAGNFFRANVVNLGSQASDVHATAYWDEV